MAIQQEEDDSDNEGGISLIKYEDMAMLSDYGASDHKDIAMIKHKDIQEEEEA